LEKESQVQLISDLNMRHPEKGGKKEGR